jgi:undecaprenyl-diphosphatase
MRVFRKARERGKLSADHLSSLRPARWFRGRYPRLSAWLALRVDPASTRGLALSLAAVGGALLVWSYGALIQDVVWNDDLALRDPGITAWAVAHRSAGVTSVLSAVTVMGSVAFLVGAIVAFGLWFRWRRGSFVPLVQLGAVFVITCGVAAVTKEAVERPRPPAADALVPALGWSFPSLHAAGAAAVFAMAGVLVARRWGARAGVVLVATAAVALVAWSRVYLGVAWFTDVLAGAALGGAVTLGAVSLSLWTRAEVRSVAPADAATAPPAVSTG